MARLFFLLAHSVRWWRKRRHLDGRTGIPVPVALTHVAQQIGEALWETAMALPRLEGAVLFALTIAVALSYCFGA